MVSVNRSVNWDEIHLLNSSLLCNFASSVKLLKIQFLMHFSMPWIVSKNARVSCLECSNVKPKGIEKSSVPQSVINKNATDIRKFMIFFQGGAIEV